MSKDRRTNYQKYNQLYKLYCPRKDLRFICFYCGMPAGTVDHVPALNKVEELRAIYEIQHYTKVPACSECNGVAGDEPHLEVFERRRFLKDKLKKRYKKYIKLPDWEDSEIKPLGYALKMNVEAAMSIKYLVAYRLTYGEEMEIKASDLGYLEYDPRKIFKYAKAENWDKSIKAVEKKEMSLREVNKRFKEVSKRRIEEREPDKRTKNKLSYSEARNYVRKLGLKNTADYVEWRAKNLEERKKLPPTPPAFYGDSWKGWEDFLGKSYINKSKKLSRNYLDFKAAQKLVRKNKIVLNSSTYAVFQRENKILLPASPMNYYSNEWSGWEDFLGKNYKSKIANRRFLSYKEAKKLLHPFKLKNSSDYQLKNKEISKLLPSNPSYKYPDEWCGWESFLGSGYKKRKVQNQQIKRSIYSFSQAKEIIQGVEEVHSSVGYSLYIKSKRDLKMPPSPPEAYKKEWMGWEDFLGKNYKNLNKEKGNFMPYNEAMKLLKKRKVRSIREYRRFIVDIYNNNERLLPSVPNKTYKKDWVSWNEFLYKED